MLVTPFIIFVDKNDLIFEFVTLNFLIFFAGIAAVLATLLWLAPWALLKISALTLLLLFLIDIQFDWPELWGWKIAAIGAAIFLTLWILRAHAAKILTTIFATTTAITLLSPLSDYVLQNFDEEELMGIDKISKNINDSIGDLIKKKLDLFSSTVNNK